MFEGVWRVIILQVLKERGFYLFMLASVVQRDATVLLIWVCNQMVTAVVLSNVVPTLSSSHNHSD